MYLRILQHMATKYKTSEECVSAENARIAVEALNEHIMNQTRRGAYIADIDVIYLHLSQRGTNRSCDSYKGR